MMNKVVIGDATLIHGDSLIELPNLGECADLCVTDAPYMLTSGGNGDYVDWHLSHDYANTGEIVKCDINWGDWMPIAFNALRGNAHFYTFCNNRHIEEMFTEAKKVGFRPHNLLAWDKMGCTPNKFYMKNLEFIGFFFKGKAKTINNPSSQQLIACPQENYMNHPTTKATGLLQYYIENSSNPGDVVLDMFMGTASTGIAALRSGRKFIGIELEERWFNASVKRIEDFYNKPQQISMF